MTSIKSIDGKVVTDAMINKWTKALDKDKWPNDWVNVGPVNDGLPNAQTDAPVSICVKVPAGLKNAVQREAKEKGITTSEAIRCALSDWVLASA